MIVDCILFNGERDIFDLRYNILKDYVDEFVVVEFGKTFSGKDKESHPINLPKVSYHFFTQVKDLKPNLPPAFAMEYNQREMMKECLAHLDDEDLILMGDCDEIPDVNKLEIDEKARLRVYAYYLNNRSSEEFALGTVFMEYGELKNKSLNDLRTSTPLSKDYAGHHFTNMGGIDKLKYKIESYGHQEFNIPIVKDNLENQIKENKDYIGRDFKMWVSEEDWPPWLKENREKFAHLLK